MRASLPRPSVPLLTSPAIWSALPVAALVLYGFLTLENPYPADPYWDAYLARASAGFNYALPVTAGLSAWIANRYQRAAIARQLRPTRGAIRIYWSLVWPSYLGVAVGYVATIIWQVSEITPSPAIPNFGLVACFLGMTATAVSAGYIIGAMLHAAFAVPLSILSLFAWITYPQFNVDSFSLRNITGYTVYDCCDSYYSVPDARSLLAPLLVAIPVSAGAILVTKHRRRRIIPPATGLAALATAAAAVVVAGTAAYPQSARAAVSTSCAGQAPVICLFPDQGEGSRGDEIRRQLTAAWATAQSAGVLLPEKLVADEMISHSYTHTNIHLSTSTPTRDSVARDYAASVWDSLACPDDRDAPNDKDQRITYALAVAMGGDLVGVLPHLSTSIDASSASTDLPTSQVQKVLHIRTHSQAVAAARDWLASTHTCRSHA